jgi:hypothetical protein
MLVMLYFFRLVIRFEIGTCATAILAVKDPAGWRYCGDKAK